MSERHGLTVNGKARTRPLASTIAAGLPPVLAREETPGYLAYPPLGIWVYAEDYTTVIEVAQEVGNKKITSRHGTRATKNRGCSGPLCRKALRDKLYGGAKTVRLKRIDELLVALQEHHDEEWVNSLPPEERERLLANANKIVTTMQQKLDILKV